MANSISTTSNTQTPTLATNQVTLDIGYVLVCAPTLHPYGKESTK